MNGGTVSAWVTELSITWQEAALVVISAIGIYLAVLTLSRLYGPRSFSQASSFDLALVVSMGAIIGRVVLVRTSLAAGVLGLATMFVIHATVNRSSHHPRVVKDVVSNSPILLVEDGTLLEDNIRRAHETQRDLCTGPPPRPRIAGHRGRRRARAQREDERDPARCLAQRRGVRRRREIVRRRDWNPQARRPTRAQAPPRAAHHRRPRRRSGR